MDKAFTYILVILSAVFIGMLSLLGLVAIKQYNKAPARSIASITKSATVRLVRNGHTMCSGFVINDTTIVTAGHCVVFDTPYGLVLMPGALEIRSSDNRPLGVMAKVEGVSPQLDRAILKGNFKRFPKAAYSDSVADSVAVRVPGYRFITCGYPLGGALFCGLLVYQHDTQFFLSTRGVIIPGMSGGPVMTEQGVVIAINHAVGDDESIVAPIYNLGE